MLVDDSISRGGSILASSAPGEKGGHISLLDLPMERDGREPRPHLHTQPQHSHTQLTINCSQDRHRHCPARNHVSILLLTLTLLCSGRHLHCATSQPGWRRRRVGCVRQGKRKGKSDCLARED